MYTYKAEVLSIYDGDTITVNIDLGFNLKKEKIKIRLARINTPEIRTRDLEEKAAGYAARDYLREFIEKYKDSICIQTTFKGKYGRWVGEVLVDLSNHEWDEDIVDEAGALERYLNVNDHLVKNGYGVYKEY